jgi:hypothetical protein
MWSAYGYAVCSMRVCAMQIAELHNDQAGLLIALIILSDLPISFIQLGMDFTLAPQSKRLPTFETGNA